MKQAQFEALYRAQWQTFADYLERIEQTPGPGLRRRARPAGLTAAELRDFSNLYRKICYYHTLARDRQYSSLLVDRLGDLVVRGHQQFYRRSYPIWRNILAFVVADFPALVRQEQRFVWLATLVLAAPAVLLFLAILLQPHWVYAVVSPAQVQEFEAMYNPGNRVLGSARDAGTNWQMFGFYINNNIGVSFRTFASGLAWGAGSMFFLFYNGLLLGAVAGHLTEVGFHQPFFSFVIGHGSFELTAIAIAGAAGLRLGYGLLVPGNRSRLASLRASAAVAVRLVYGVIVMLVIAAFIEAFWSSSGVFAYWQKYLVGSLLWLLVIGYLVFGGRRGSE